MASFNSYDLKGKKLSFANWISNLSPTETPFCSMTGKEAVNQTEFFWQTDRLRPAEDNKQIEGVDVSRTTATPDTKMNDTTSHHNYTQILRKSFKVSDTANVLANYGRGREVAYQMEKFSQALKRDLEVILLSHQDKDSGAADNKRKTSGFARLVLNKTGNIETTNQDADIDTGAVTFFKTGVNNLLHAHIQVMTYNLYLANSEANVIMFHPKHAHFFAKLQGEETSGSVKMFDGDDTEFSLYVNTYIDEFGRSYKLVPNRFMPQDMLYFFNPSDFTQMLLRAPQKVELAKKGNFQHWMIEMEVGLRLRDPYAAGVIYIKA